MRLRAHILCAGLCLATTHAAPAADPVTYNVIFRPSGDPALDSLLKQSSALLSLRTKLPPAPFALIGRAQDDEASFATVLHSLGFDAGSVTITINGTTLDDPALLDTLTQTAKPVTVTILPAKGALFHLGRIDATALPAGYKLPIHPGQTATAAPILAVTPALLTAWHDAGYAFAHVSAPVAVADLATHRLDVTYDVTPGPRVDIGAVDFTGLGRTNPVFLRSHIEMRRGALYSDQALADARGSLLGLGIFSAVSPSLGTPRDGTVPIIFHTTPLKRHAVTLSASYATDQGITLSTSWEDRNVFGNAENLTLTAAGNGIGGTGTTAPGYDVKAVFNKPDVWHHAQELSLSGEVQQESLTAYSRTALLLAANLSHPLSKHVSLTYGPAFVAENVLQESVWRSYLLLQFPVTLSYNTADSALEPTNGVIASATLTPTEPAAGQDHSPFLIAQASASAYLAVEPAARGIVALRGQLGSIVGTTQLGVPPDQRFYAGGSGTVRGYTYQTIGPLFADDNPQGGLAFDAASLEFRQRVATNFGIVPFVDAGQVNARAAPFQGTLRIGVGVGLRYYTGIGPIRFDIAFPLTRIAGSGGFALYIGLGEAF
jgi:translocation and assembly module TamA